MTQQQTPPPGEYVPPGPDPVAYYIGAVFFLVVPFIVMLVGVWLSPPHTAQAGGWFGVMLVPFLCPLGLYLGFKGDHYARLERAKRQKS